MVDTSQLRKQISTLDKGDDAARRQVLSTLRQHGDQEWVSAPPDAIHSLVESLRHQLQSHQLLRGVKQPSIHKDVAALLGNMGPQSKAAIPQLIELLQDGISDSIREAAVTALGKIGRDAKSAVEPIIALCGGRNGLAIHAVRALGDIGCADQRVKAALVSLWQTPQTQTCQVQVAFSLCKLKIEAPDLPGVLTGTLMTHQDASLRKAAAEALAWCNKDATDVVAALLAASMHDKNEDVQQVAKSGLELMRLTPEKAVRLCAKQLNGSYYAEAALRKAGAISVPALIEALSSKDPGTLVIAARTLACLGELALEAVPALTNTLRDKNPEVRLAAAKSVWNVTKKADAAVPVLVKLLDEKWPGGEDAAETRRKFLQTVIEALWRIGPDAAAAVPALAHMAKDKNRFVSESARDAIKKIAPGAAK